MGTSTLPEIDHGRTDIGVLRLTAILVASSRIWRRELRSLTLLAAALEIPLVVAEIALQVTPGLKSFEDDRFTFTATALLVLLYGSLSHHFLAGILEQVVRSERQGHDRPTLGEIRYDLRWRRLVVADLPLTAMDTGGMLFLVIPGLVILTWFSVALPIVNLERNPVLASFARSAPLVVLAFDLVDLDADGQYTGVGG